ncbi:MAG: GNAT family N-acetyltransferase [Rudaea sp.]
MSAIEPQSAIVQAIPPAAVQSAVDMQWTETLRDGTSVLIRPIRDEDAERERRFIEALTPESRRFRFLGGMTGASPALLKQLVHIDHASEAAFVAVGAEDGDFLGVSRYSARSDGLSCECAVTVSDEWHDKGLATLLMHHLVEVARRRGIRSMYSLDAADNVGMRALAEHLGFTRKADPDDSTLVIHTLDLPQATTT